LLGENAQSYSEKSDSLPPTGMDNSSGDLLHLAGELEGAFAAGACSPPTCARFVV